MSSARSNAAARSRRAGGADNQQQQQLQQNGNVKQTGPVKLSVSDAIGLITLRLGRVEQILQNMPVDGGSTSIQGLGENARIVDDAVFLNIIQRLEALEKGQLTLKQDLQKIPTNAPTLPLEKFEKIDNDIENVKTSLLQLQSFTMQTNQQLSEMLIKKTIVERNNTSVEETSEQTIEQANKGTNEEDTQTLIQTQIQSTEVVLEENDI
uniref:Uncharacterized protein n=1 Tax=viral metagenome TaxID=1070528 RepID=A0A6C0B109_9ZZZZ